VLAVYCVRVFALLAFFLVLRFVFVVLPNETELQLLPSRLAGKKRPPLEKDVFLMLHLAFLQREKKRKSQAAKSSALLRGVGWLTYGDMVWVVAHAIGCYWV